MKTEFTDEISKEEMARQLAIAREVRHNRDELFKEAIRKRDKEIERLRRVIINLGGKP